MFSKLCTLRNKKGFTLAELLIVVAIIAVLVAIAIPVFTSSLNKAKVSTDLANMRAAKAAALVAHMDSSEAIASSTYNTDGTIGTSGTAIKTKGSYSVATDEQKADFTGITGLESYDSGKTISVAVSADGEVTFTIGS